MRNVIRPLFAHARSALSPGESLARAAVRPADDDRVERERAFHNGRFSHEIDPRQHLDKWYASIRHGAERQDAMVRAYAAGKDVLEYGCADGSLSLEGLGLPRISRSLTGIDISDVAIEKAEAAAAYAGLQNARFLAMDAEAMNFPDQSFDLVFGRGILHHLDLEKCLREISRVLRENGLAIFCEPMGHNPLLNLYRKRTPAIRTADEHPLLVADLEAARRHFAKVDAMFYGLFSVASLFLDRTGYGLPYRVGRSIDDAVLRLPFIGRYAWHCLIVFHKRDMTC